MSKASWTLHSRSTAGALTSMIGRWENELGSIMTITDQQPSGGFSGTYTSTVSGSGQQVSGPITGSFVVDSVGWVVNWSPAFNSTTSWAGKILQEADGTPVIYTLWNLSRELTDPESDWWESFLSGSDRFRKI